MIRVIGLFFCLSFTVILWANNIDVQLVQQSDLTSEPGKVNNFSIAIINNGTNPTQLLPKLEVPDGWKVITNKSVIRLEVGEKRIQLLSFIVPAKTLAGDYQITYHLIDPQQRKDQFTSHFDFKIKATNKIGVVPLSAPNTVIAGAKMEGEFLVENKSNQVQEILLTSRNGKIVGNSRIVLAPFANQKVMVQTTTFAETKREGRVSLDLNATINGLSFNRTGYLHARILPSFDYEEDDTRKLPGYASLNLLHRQFGDGRVGQGWQGELFLQGAIDEKKEKEVTLSLRGPNQQESAELTLYDEYFATYQTKDFAVTLGDHNYILSPLTEFSRNGRGIKAEGYFGTATVGTFYVKPRFFADLDGEVGAFVQNKFSPKSTIRFNYLHKISANIDVGNASIMSIFGQFKPLENTLIEAELAANNSGEGAYINIQSRFLNRFRFNGNLTYASPKFSGYFQNTLNFLGHLNYRLNKRINVIAGVFQDDRNAALDTLFQAAPLIDRRYVGLRIKIGQKTQFQANLRQNEIEDRLPQKQFFRKENLITAGLNHSTRFFNLGLMGEYGKSQNFLKSSETAAQDIFRAFADLGVTTNHFSLTLFGQYYSENNLQLADQQQFLWGGALIGNIKKTRIQLRYQNDFVVEEYYKNRNALDFFVTQQIKKNQQFSINARQTIRRNTLDQKDLMLSAKYTYNFGIRLEEKPPTGNVYGQIQRSDSSSTKGILVYLNGKTAVADAAGNFQFKNMKPGKYPIMLDPSTLGLHEILANATLQMVEVLPELDQTVQLELIQSGAVIGHLDFKQSAKPSAKLMSLKTVGNLMLEITNGQETRRTFTDDNGQFKFGDLRPGTWQVAVLKSSVDKSLSLAQSNFTINIEEGQQVNLPISIQQKKRNIQFKKLIQLSDDDS